MPMNPTRMMREGRTNPYTVESWGPGGSIKQQFHSSESYDDAVKAYQGAVKDYPDEWITMRKGALVMSKNRED